VGEDHGIMVSHGTDENDAVVICSNDNATDRREHENAHCDEEGKTEDGPKGGFINGRSQSLSLKHAALVVVLDSHTFNLLPSQNSLV
jgi:hypothetical protein